MAAKNRRMFELRLGKLGLVLFVGGMSLLLCSMFFLGILVGKHMEAYPERFSPGVVEFIRENLFSFASRAGKPVPAMETAKRDVTAGGEEDGLADALGGKKEGAATGKMVDALKDLPEASLQPAASSGKTAISEPAAGTAGGTGVSAAPHVAGRDPVKPNPVQEKKPAADSGSGVPVAAPAVTAVSGQENPGEGLFEIQVAAYQDRPKAEQAMEKLKPLGFASRIVQKDIAGKGRWFRVIVGGFENRDKAKTAADLIAGKVRGVKCVIRPSGKNGGG